jgi:Zn-dependent metalloprotease
MNKKVILAMALGFSSFGAWAQTVTRESAGKPGMYPVAVVFEPGKQPDFVKGQVLIKDHETYRQSGEVIFKTSEKDMLGQEHFRYQQTINGIPVDGTGYIVHAAGGKVVSQNGTWVAEPSAGIASVPTISENAALENAMKAFGARAYKWQLPAEEQFIKAESGNPDATFMPKPTLVYYSGEADVNADNLRLAWQLDLYAHDPIGRRIYFIDAKTGTVLGKREVMHNADASGTAVTAYSGSQSITTDSYAGSYRLRENGGRGNGIQTFNLRKSTNYSSAVDFTDADNYWNNVNSNWDQYATDAHWGAEKTYDYYKSTFNRNSINNAGFAIKSYVHYSNNYFNAFWDGSRMTYGDGGNTDGNKPLTAIDVCGHEITHGLTSYTANLNYSYESGALNEGFSDIFGTTIEFYAKPGTANWLIGEAFYTIRSMSNPNAYGQPDTYKGTNWATGSSDNGGVHTNSGVLNYWYYLLVTGGSGTNDKGTAYTVSGIGMSKAAAIAYRTLTVYLVSTSQYADARTYSIQAATDLYGATSNEVAQVTAAWDAVGVGNVTTPSCTDTYEANETISAAKPIALNSDISAKISTTTDKDWYTFTTTSTAPKLKVTLSNLPADYDLRLYNSGGSQLGISQNGSTTSESITYNSSSAGTYYIQVYGYAGANNNSVCYTVRAATSNVNLLTDEEANLTGHSLTKGKEQGTMDDDALRVFPNPAKEQLTLRFNAAVAGTQSLSVTDPLGRVIMQKTIDVQDGFNNIKVSLDNLESGLYFIKMEGRPAVKFQISE